MIVTKDSPVTQTEAAPSYRGQEKSPDWQGLYHALLAQLMSQAEGMVAQAFAAQAEAHGIPVPAAVASVLRAEAARSGSNEGSQAEQDATAGVTGSDHHDSDAPAHTSAMPTPPWLRPFTLPEKVRFTRTPDPVMRWERSRPTAEELATRAQEAARIAAEEATRIAREEMDRARGESTIPSWRKPFTLPPNVRYTRTPDPKTPKAEPTATETQARVQESISTTESQDGAFRSVTVTKTVTTVESVTMSPGELHEEDATLFEALVAPAEAPTADATESGSAPSAEAALPPWFSIIRQSANLGLDSFGDQDNRTQAALAANTAASLWEDADSDSSAVLRGVADIEPAVTTQLAPASIEDANEDAADADSSAALFRSAFLPEMDDAATVSFPSDIEPTETAKLLAAEDEVEAEEEEPEQVLRDSARVIAMPLGPQRRAFGSHGIPAFESAVHYAGDIDSYDLPDVDLLAPPRPQDGLALTREALEQNARLLEGILEDFGIRGEIIAVRPGPVVTLYELEPAPGVKSSRVVNLADDIARSMSAISARVAVVQGRNVIGIELPNERRETVFFRELVEAESFEESNHRLAIALGKTIGGEPVIVDLARMPHLLVAGTTGSGKSVAINTMILSLLYRMKPEECRLIMVDPKMLELSIYDGIPHLLTPVVTDSKKAVIALKWAVREMEDRYKKMAKVGVRNIDGFNARLAEAKKNGEKLTRTVQHGFDRETGEAIYETEEMDLSPLPYIVIIVDEMADLMMVAGKEIEGAIQRLAQMARAAGIHLIMATQRPSVDVITGTIKANFPTRISFQVTSKIDSRTILGEMGAEQLLGQGDMLHMAGGGRIVRVHGPFVSDGEVEKVVNHLKLQGHPEYLDVVTADAEEGEDDPQQASDEAVFDKGNFGEEGGDLYEQALKVVFRDKKCSTSYIQRRLQVGYNKAASLVERMEKEGLVGPANPTGKREILNYSRERMIVMPGDMD